MQQGFTAGDGNDRRATLVYGGETFVHAQPAIENFVGVINLAATSTSEITPEQRLQHQYQRVLGFASKFLLHKVFCNSELLP